MFRARHLYCPPRALYFIFLLWMIVLNTFGFFPYMLNRMSWLFSLHFFAMLAILFSPMLFLYKVIGEGSFGLSMRFLKILASLIVSHAPIHTLKMGQLSNVIDILLRRVFLFLLILLWPTHIGLKPFK